MHAQMASIARMSKSGAFLQRPETIPKYDIDIIDPVRVNNPHGTTRITFPRPDADNGPQPPRLQARHRQRPPQHLYYMYFMYYMSKDLLYYAI
jgi:hypothetical protein